MRFLFSCSYEKPHTQCGGGDTQVEARATWDCSMPSLCLIMASYHLTSLHKHQEIIVWTLIYPQASSWKVKVRNFTSKSALHCRYDSRCLDRMIWKGLIHMDMLRAKRYLVLTPHSLVRKKPSCQHQQHQWMIYQ